MRYTLVQHSAWTARGDENFFKAVETQAVGERQAEKVLAAGGVVYPDYLSADEAEYAENYPEGSTGLIPQAKGRFSASVHIEGSALYIPAPVKEVTS